ncbi:MAG: TRAP transporter substrate-binding protein DctP, partial [Chloroflexi bacterium]|nr:TRAP transporter substrate-binding protein DctP [Chloroflexota bacterium]
APAPAPAPRPAPAPQPAPAPAPKPAPAPAPQSKPVVLKAVTSLPQLSTSNLPMWWLRDRVKEKSRGELTINLLGGPEVIPAPDQATAVKKGVVDISQLFTSAYVGLVPIGNVFNLSTMSPAEERAIGFHAFFAEQAGKAGLYYLGRGAVTDRPDNYYIAVKKKIERPQELARLKIGGSTPASDSFLKELGAVPVRMPQTEFFIAADTGVIDGMWTSIANYASLKIYELKLFLIDQPYYHSNASIIMNPETFNGLPQHLKNILLEAQLEMEKAVPAIQREEAERHKKAVVDGGMTLIKFTPADAKWFLDTAVNVGWEEEIKRNPELGPKARELLTKK